MQAIRPQKGFQEQALSTPADIAVIGGSAGGGKTFTLLLEGARNINNRKFTTTIFRRTTPQIRSAGGLWDTSQELYPYCGGIPRESTLEWIFPSKAKINFKQIEHETDLNQWQGAQIGLIMFDELTHFTKNMFIYMLSRNRSMSGIKPYIRATCNPDPSSWVADFIKWWIDEETGYPIPERVGVLRYMTNIGGTFIWGDTVEEVVSKAPHLLEESEKTGIPVEQLVKSVTFIPGSIYDNKLLLKNNPAYLSNLHALDPEEKKRLLDGNWKVSLDGMEIFEYHRIKDIFSNHVDTALNKRYITCDAARFGRDFCVIMVWKGWEVVEMHVYKQSDTTDVVKKIEQLRAKFLISKYDVLIDQDGVGGNVVSLGGYQGFSGGAAAMRDTDTRIKENYKNLKTQCYYRLAELRVNTGMLRVNVNSDVCFVYDSSKLSGQRSTKIKVGREVFDISELIQQDLRAVKRKEPDKESKKQINGKDEQKEILGRSPDFGDTLMMREYLELRPAATTMKRKN